MPGETPSTPRDRAGALAQIVHEIQLWWRLFRHPRVPAWTKVIPLLTVFYILFPLDLIMDPILGLGQLDDLALFLLGMELFVALSPPDVVEAVRREIRLSRRGAAEGRGETVDASYRVVDELPGEGSRGELTRSDGPKGA
ncbi:MAG: DUF1232 domain-containing protein [Anaerolineae bacterium]|nr:DUF1232 domain-containing protein [Anaerolineae bacterium]